MARVKKNLSFSPDILAEMHEACKKCCNGNMSEYFRRLHRGAHSANKIKMSELERVIRMVIKEEVRSLLRHSS